MTLVSGAIGYLVGSLPLGFLVARRWAGVDLRNVGSGNVGATNMLRVSGPRLGLLVMVVDMAKGLGAVILAGRVASTEADSVTAGVAAVAGHMFPLWLGGRGGKGVATAFGAFAVLAPGATGCAALTFASTAWATRLASAASLCAAVTLPVAAAAFDASRAVVTGSLSAAALIVWRHRGNIQRLWRGTERRIGRAGAGDPRA